ncbi:MAG: hypothetical protein RR053_02250 [Evtepia sp.]
MSLAVAPVACGTTLMGAAFDGCHYYFTACEAVIVKYEPCTKVSEEIPVCRSYTCICYDSGSCCFWATSGLRKIYKLNRCFQEIDCITLGCRYGGVITGLSYDCCEDALLVSAASVILKVELQGDCVQRILSLPCEFVTCILALAPGFLTISLRDGEQICSVYGGDCTRLRTYHLSCDTEITSLLFSPHENRQFSIVALEKKHGCYSYLEERSLNVGVLGFMPAQCNWALEPPPCPPPTKDCRAEIMESVALMEASLAHILNAEGEKLQKVIACSNDIDEILCVNRAVKETIIRATHLEQVLFEKLSLVSDCCDSCQKDRTLCTSLNF